MEDERKKGRVERYFARLDFWRDTLGLTGYNQKVFKKAQEDYKKYLKSIA